MNMTTTALMLLDMQNDFIHADGAYGRSGTTSEHIAALPARLKPVADSVRRAGGWIISTHFTMVPGKGGEPFISEHLKQLRPFLAKGDFTPGGWGQSLINELAPADLSVEKVAFSAFYMSRLDWVLQQAGITDLICAGIVTNGGVASTVRDAHVHGYHCTVLADGCATFDLEVHKVAIESLRPIADIATCEGIIEQIG